MADKNGDTLNETQLVTFVLAGEEFGAPITFVKEIVRVPDITRIPKAPHFVEGVANLRGNILTDRGGAPVVPELLLPGFLLQNSNTPMLYQPPGSTAEQDAPGVAYVEEVEYSVEDGLKLKFPDAPEGIAVLEALAELESAL